MYTPKKMRLNKFVAVKCPSAKDLYQRVGQRMPNMDNFSSDGSDFSNVVDFNSSQIEQLQSMAMAERQQLYAEYQEKMRKQQEEAEKLRKQQEEQTT